MRICSVDGCDRKHSGLGFCWSHHRRFRLYGDPLKGQRSERGSLMAWLLERVSHDGDDCLLWPFGRKDDYGLIVFRGKSMRASRAMCILAHGDPPTPIHEAAHSCGVPLCENPNHLRWATPLENSADKRLHGTMLRGEQVPIAKVTEAAVKEIRRLYADREASQDALARRFGIGQSTIHSIVHRKTWSHVE